MLGLLIGDVFPFTEDIKLSPEPWTGIFSGSALRGDWNAFGSNTISGVMGAKGVLGGVIGTVSAEACCWAMVETLLEAIGCAETDKGLEGVPLAAKLSGGNESTGIRVPIKGKLCSSETSTLFLFCFGRFSDNS